MYAIGLGELRVQSGLGQSLKATVGLLGADGGEIHSSCIRAKVESSEGTFLTPASVAVVQNGLNKLIKLSTRQNLAEPAVKVIVDVACEAQLHREYVVLLDPPQFNTSENATLIALPAVQSLPDSSTNSNERDTRKSPVKTAKPASGDQQKREIVISKLPSAPSVIASKVSKKSTHKDVLKLSDENVVLPQGLRLSDSLSAPGDQRTGNVDELRLEQAHLAAFLRGDNAAAGSEISSDLKAEQKKVQALQMEATQLKKQSQMDRAALDEVRESSFSRNWLIALFALVLAGLLIIAFLMFYINRLHKRVELSWWEQGQNKKNPEPKKSLEELVNSVQASYGTTTGDSLYQVREMDVLTKPGVDVEKIAENVDSGWGTTGPGIRPTTVRSSTPTLEESNSSTFNFFSTRGASVKVEEISDVTQEAEFWMSVNDPHRAIEILEPQAEIQHPDSPVPWLYLLDLYREVKDREKYDALRDRFILFFNANIPEFEVDPKTLPARQLEDFAHLMGRICDLWSSNDILPFLQSLLVDDRDGKRMGFELPVYRDILLLISIAHELERNKASGGSVIGAFVKAPDVATLDHPHSSGSTAQSDSNFIDFESIDFRKKT